MDEDSDEDEYITQSTLNSEIEEVEETSFEELQEEDENNKSPGINNIQVELTKLGGKNLTSINN
jgi:hypothetical protein